MHYFYRRAFVAFVLLLILDALIACFCIYQSYPTSSLMPREKRAAHWHFAALTDGPDDAASTVRIHDTGQQSLSFDFKLSRTITYPWASVALLIDDADGKPAPGDMSKYSTVTFLAKCAPANSLIFNITTVDERGTGSGEKLTTLPVMTFFSCNEKGTPVSLDLTRLAIPEWWYEVAHVDIARRTDCIRTSAIRRDGLRRDLRVGRQNGLHLLDIQGGRLCGHGALRGTLQNRGR